MCFVVPGIHMVGVYFSGCCMSNIYLCPLIMLLNIFHRVCVCMCFITLSLIIVDVVIIT